MTPILGVWLTWTRLIRGLQSYISCHNRILLYLFKLDEWEVRSYARTPSLSLLSNMLTFQGRYENILLSLLRLGWCQAHNWHKVYGCYLVCFHALPLQPNSFNTKWNLWCIGNYATKQHQQIGLPLIHLWLSEVHVCQFLDWVSRASQVCSLLCVE